MQIRRTIGPLTMLIAALWTAGCATAGGAAGPAHNVQITVDNNLSGIVGVSAYVVTEGGSRRSLGPVESNRRTAFDKELPTGSYHLIATRVGASDIVSDRFRIDEDVAVMWNLSSNVVTFAQ